jgi:hypothetical protein
MISLEESPMIYAQMEPTANVGLITAKSTRRRARAFGNLEIFGSPPPTLGARAINLS